MLGYVFKNGRYKSTAADIGCCIFSVVHTIVKTNNVVLGANRCVFPCKRHHCIGMFVNNVPLVCVWDIETTL